MNRIDEKLGAWSGPLFAVLLGIGLLLAGFIPLPSPAMAPEDVIAIYQSRPMMIRIGMLIAITGVIFVVPFTATISTRMLHAEGIGRMAAYLQLGAGSAGAILLLIPPMLLAIASFRPDRDPSSTLLLHDVAWLFFIAPFPLAIAQNLGIAIVAFLDRSARPAFPRWVGYFNIWVALLFIPGGFAFFFRTGPFAWNGLLAFWVAASAFFVWVFVMAAMLARGIKNDGVTSRE